ncbi:MAG TPA: bifunctional diaminohydroxyphosphoribosylaminopyrimidine deaminase/5-amino-6-(5-phosphoribosylamino)uracil reductase RibD [Verrucomicrobiota bacterium]|jgi:diaminohydroxyphosphoribosylaminopyrimidine deaminase/5-amino-6-(5-phosphoribosylamino)uracil reductase|nr:bifunctional diaminohydroxyphosphoribosylaminopyrimidine deaminase/5-amino-6-(5-phosphoribosylamino)uracil reductase RibD [Verrucomicrobiota bacterium]HPY32069.1 bifunctional diaminohydroxyphosphoribosylaminopyrimidine deaminase/5-amino-6-(5-phosphoribosylamino)uracil reductase RibD [Verrucomicrobiota bacterium]HQB18196.1 bifunctional diaminohydroxyphosphoribosylaminopyrimidine deaminase/5-amino-6-(5-phosphoribosylamino)uracil reductase RibD [Verrucomicrobiota bacterium]
MRRALRYAQRGRGLTSPNPLVGAVLVKGGRLIGRGWHRQAGGPHAEIEALRDAQKRGFTAAGATLYVTLEPCCTQGRTPPCTDALIAARLRRVVGGATDPNPRHAGRGFTLLERAGLIVTRDVLAAECGQLNTAFNHWIVQRTPFVTVKAAMTLDGKIATARGESQWITGEPARAYGMELRRDADAILVGINTILADDPRLTWRTPQTATRHPKMLRRIVLDSQARTPLQARIVSDAQAVLTTIVVSRQAPRKRVAALAQRVRVLVAPLKKSVPHSFRTALDLRWLLRRLGAENITHLLVEGGGEVNASFLLQRLAHRVAFFYAPKILGGRDARKAVGGEGARTLTEAIRLRDIHWRRLGDDLLLEAAVD